MVQERVPVKGASKPGSTVPAALANTQRLPTPTTVNPSVQTMDTAMGVETPSKGPRIPEGAALEPSTPPRKRRRLSDSGIIGTPKSKSPRKRSAKATDATDDSIPQTPAKASSSAEKPVNPPKTPKRREGKTVEVAESPQTPTRAEASRQAREKQFAGRKSLYLKEVYKHPAYNFGFSDLKAIPVIIAPNPHHKEALDTRCYQVAHLDWLKDRIGAGNGLNLPSGSTINQEDSRFVLENGEAICKDDAITRYNDLRLRSEQLNRLRPCKRDRPEGRTRAVDQWNLCDIEALLQQGEYLKAECPYEEEPVQDKDAGSAQPGDLDNFHAYTHSLLGVGSSGIIDWIVHDVAPHELQNTLASKGLLDVEVIALKDGDFLMPGFIDTHSHAPQFPNLGIGLEFQLLPWLQKVVFPTEQRFCDENYATAAYKSVIKRVLDCGTTTCCYYGSLHLRATEILAEIAHNYGQRAFIGKCNMNREKYCPDDYIEPSAEDSVDKTRKLITHIRHLHKHHHHECHGEHGHDSHKHHYELPLVQPILTPRFAIACTKDLLEKLGDLVKEDPSLIIQTHIAENPDEVKTVHDLYPEADNYTDVYRRAGLLRENTILGHGIYLDDAELDMIKEHGAGVAHCPGSNFYLTSGVAQIGKYLDKGVKVGLGTDVAGGYSPSLLNTIQNASIASKVIELKARESAKPESKTADAVEKKYTDKQLRIATLFYLATLGGAHVCGLAKHTGSLEAGKAFDALIVNTRGSHLSPTFWDPTIGYDREPITRTVLRELLERFLFNGDDRSIERVYVQGRWVGGHGWRPKPRDVGSEA